MKSIRATTSIPSSLPAEIPKFIPPMKARVAEMLPEGNDWIYEIKFDGIRAIAVKAAGVITLYSRRPRDLTAQFPDVVEALKKLGARQFALDGEVVALDEKGRSSFQLLQNRGQDAAVRSKTRYYMFDLLNLNGRDVRQLPLRERKKLLQKLLANAPDPLRFSSNLEGSPKKIWKETQRLGLEGIIAKLAASRYEPDLRTGAWMKIKTRLEQEFVIGGYTVPKGGRKFFGAILIGYYRDGKLVFASKVGTGFDDASLKSLHQTFTRLRWPNCPFSEGIAELGAADLRRCTWVKPKLVCQVKFAEWTGDGKLRQPVFLGLRDDKPATEVVRETPP